MKKLKPLLLAWAAGLAIWLVLSCVSLAKTAWSMKQQTIQMIPASRNIAAL